MSVAKQGGGAIWLGVPTVLEHVVDEASPLRGVARGALRASGWEVVVLLDGIDESSCTAFQASPCTLPFVLSSWL